MKNDVLELVANKVNKGTEGAAGDFVILKNLGKTLQSQNKKKDWLISSDGIFCPATPSNRFLSLKVLVEPALLLLQRFDAAKSVL